MVFIVLPKTVVKALVASTVSPIRMIRACGMVPIASLPIISALFKMATPSKPPMKELRSTTGATAG
jgi:hypothetical protein